MVDMSGFETAFVIFAATLAVLVAVGIGLVVSTVRREREEALTSAGSEPAPERTREPVS